MALVISERIRKREFKRGAIPAEDRVVLLRCARADLATAIKGHSLPAGTRLLKAYATSPAGPRRVVFLFASDDGTLFLLFYRGKNDPVGRNITIQNPAFRRELHKHLELLRADIEAKRFEVIGS